MKKAYLLIFTFYFCLEINAQKSWSGFAGGLNATVTTIVADTGDSFYIGGSFTNILELLIGMVLLCSKLDHPAYQTVTSNQ
jgi:hypothetical protein